MLSAVPYLHCASQLSGSLCGCIPLPMCGCTLLHMCGNWWSVSATRCGSFGVRSGLGRRVLAGVRIRGGLPCASVWLCPLGVLRCRLGGGGGAVLVPPVWCSPPLWCASRCPLSRPLPQWFGPGPFPFPVLVVLRWFLAPLFCCPRCPLYGGACLLPWASPRSLAAGLSFALSLFSVLVVGSWRGLWGADGHSLGVGGLEPPAEGAGGVGGAQALDRFPEEGFSCPLRHGALRGGVVVVGGGAGEDFLKSVEGVTPFTPSRSRGPLQPAAKLPQDAGRPPGEVGGGQAEEGLRARGPGGAVVGAWGGRCVSLARANGKRGAVRRGRRTRTWDGSGACGDGRRRGSGLGGGWGWEMHIGGAGNRKSGAVRWGGGGDGHGMAVARVVALGGAGAGPWGVGAAPQ